MTAPTRKPTPHRAVACTLSLLILVSMAGPALAHADNPGFIGGFVSGFMHPFYGWDHVLAMVAVGLWGAFLGSPAIWMLPVAFPLIMAFGGVLGIAGVPLPGVETGIAASSVVLGVLIALAQRSPLWIAVVVVGCFGVFHGHAHGTELPLANNPLTYSMGFVLATGLLHLLGIGFGLLAGLPGGVGALRTAGGAIALAGLSILLGFW